MGEGWTAVKLRAEIIILRTAARFAEGRRREGLDRLADALERVVGRL